MGQVYSFTDDNGVTRLFAEISPAVATIPGTATGGDTQLDVDAFGDLTLTNTSLTDSASITIQDASGEIDLNSYSGINIASTEVNGKPLTIRNHSGGIIGRWFDSDGSVQLGIVNATTLATAPAVSSASTLALGTAYQNTLGYNVLLVVVLNFTVNTSGVVHLGVGPTNTPTQQTIVTGVTTLGFLPVPIYLPNQYYALLTVTGTATESIVGQLAMPI